MARSSELAEKIEPELAIFQEPEQSTCSLRNVQSCSGEKAAAVSNGVDTQNKKRRRTPFCPKVLVGAELEKAITRQ